MYIALMQQPQLLCQLASSTLPRFLPLSALDMRDKEQEIEDTVRVLYKKMMEHSLGEWGPWKAGLGSERTHAKLKG
jgi:hypothetical protein